IDSAPSIYTLLRYLQLRGAQQMQFTNTNSAYLSGNLDSQDVTSYVFAHFTKGEPEKENVHATLYVPKGFKDFERIKGVEGNFLKGFDDMKEYDSDFLKSINFHSAFDPDKVYTVGEILYPNGKTKYFLFSH
ncbi:MAG: hypothetical protein Q8R08_01780, partial [bacterium]|nr:hypothetical protein [bacterium]